MYPDRVLVIMSLTILGVWLLGVGKEHTLIENSLLSTTILSSAFFLFISIGLYKGIKLKDNIGKITDRLNTKSLPDLPDLTHSIDIPDAGDGIGGIIVGIVLWIVATIVLGILMWIFGAVLWMTVLIFIAMLYWIFYRALRLVFKKSFACKGQLTKSILYGLGYTIMYNFWIYGIIFMVEMMGK